MASAVFAFLQREERRHSGADRGEQQICAEVRWGSSTFQLSIEWDCNINTRLNREEATFISDVHVYINTSHPEYMMHIFFVQVQQQQQHWWCATWLPTDCFSVVHDISGDRQLCRWALASHFERHRRWPARPMFWVISVKWNECHVPCLRSSHGALNFGQVSHFATADVTRNTAWIIKRFNKRYFMQCVFVT